MGGGVWADRDEDGGAFPSGVSFPGRGATDEWQGANL